MQKNKLFIFIFITIFLIGLTSSFGFDNVKEKTFFSKNTKLDIGNKSIDYNPIWEKYNPIKIKNSFGFGSTLWSGAIDEHTNSCGSNCYSTIDINIKKDGSLVDGIEFYEIKNNGNKIKTNIIDYQFFISTSEKNVLIDNYVSKCINFGKITKNGSQNRNCINVKNGTILKKEYTWKKYNIGEVLPAGNYKLKLDGEKNRKKTIDWIIKTNGKWVNDWAYWIGINPTAYYKFNEGSGNATDSSGNGYNMTNNGVVGFVDGKLNNASDYSGNGNTNFFQTTATSIVNFGLSDFTIAFWINRSYSSISRVLLVTDNDWLGTSKLGIITKTDSKIQVSVGGTVLLSNYNITDNEYHRIVLVRNGTGIGQTSIYIDGNETPSVIGQVSTSITGDEGLWVGGGNIGITTGTDGIIDDLQIFKGYAWDYNDILNDWNDGYGKEADFEVIVDINSPNDNIKLNDTNVNFNCSATTVAGTNIKNMSLLTNKSGVMEIVETKINIFGETNESIFNYDFISDSSYLFDCSACNDNDICTNSSSQRTLTIDSTIPELTLISPNTTFKTIVNGDNLSLNWSASDLNIDSCSFKYNNIITDVVCDDGNYSFTPINTEKSILFYVNDTINNSVSKFINWEYILFENSQTFNEVVTEGSEETIVANITIISNESLDSAVLVYNNTNYTSTISLIDDNYIISSSIFAPFIFLPSQIEFNFIIIINSEQYNLTYKNQNITEITLASCGGSSNDTLLNMSLFNEIYRNSITGDIEISASIISKTSNSIVKTISDKFSNINSGAICFSPPSSYDLYLLDAEIRYTANGYESELYMIQQADLSNYPLNLSLFILNSSSSTDFLIKYQDKGLITVEGAVIQLLRKYIQNNTYEVVEAPLTSNTGTAILHIDLDTNLYKAIVVKDGVVLDTFDNLVFNCESVLSGQCTQNLFGKIDAVNSISSEILNDFSYEVTSLNNTITTTFSIPSGTPVNINVLLEQVDMFGNKNLCNQSFLTGAGSIDCSYNDTIGDSMVYLTISKNGLIQSQQSYFIKESGSINWLGNNFFIVLVLLLSLVGVGISSPEWIVINGVITFVLAGGLFLLNGLDFVVGLSGVIWLIIISGILIFKLTKQEDR